MLTNRAGMDNKGASLAKAIERLRSLRWLGLPDQAIAIRGRSSAPIRADHFARCASSADRYGISAGTVAGSVLNASGKLPNGQCTSNGGTAAPRAMTVAAP